MLTRAHTYTAETAAFARSYPCTLSFLFSDKNGYLALNQKTEELLRDFSLTGRHGETAQGINYYLAMNKLNAVSVYDFDYYLSNVLHTKNKYHGYKPDYVTVYRGGSIGVLESKGTADANPLRSLKNGEKQMTQGKQFLTAEGKSVRNGYVSAVCFARDSLKNQRVTTVYYADPEEDHYSCADVTADLLYEYSKLFALSDQQLLIDAANELRNGNPEVLRNRVHAGQQNILCSTDIDTTRGKRVLQFGLSRFLSNTLLEMRNGDALDPLDFLSRKENLENEPESDGYTQYFNDGTFMRLI